MAVLSDPISDFLTRLKNASLAGNEEFTAPCSNIKVEIARILQEEGYIWNYEVSGDKIQAVHMLPGYTHNIINLSETEDLVTVMYCNEVFNPNRADTYFDPVEKK